MSGEPVEVHGTAGNIFAEPGLPDAETHFLKAQIVADLHGLVKAEGLTQAKAGARMGISQPEVSRLFKGHFREYSIERLMGFLTAFHHDVEIVAKPRHAGDERGKITFRHERA